MDAILSLGVTSLVDRSCRCRNRTGPDGRPDRRRRTTALARPPSDARPAAAGRLLRQLDGRDVRRRAGAGCGGSCAFTPGSRWWDRRSAWRSRRPSSAVIVYSATVGLAEHALAVRDRRGRLDPLAVRALWKWFWLARADRPATSACSTATSDPLRQVLMRLPARDIDGQPLPDKQRTDDRYELLDKLQGVLKSLGFEGVVVLVDRVDEPHLINGSVERMRALRLVDARQQVPQAARPGPQAAAADRAGGSSWSAKTATSTSGPGSTSKTWSRRWNGPAEALYDLANARIRGLCGARASKPTLARLCSTTRSATSG